MKRSEDQRDRRSAYPGASRSDDPLRLPQKNTAPGKREDNKSFPTNTGALLVLIIRGITPTRATAGDQWLKQVEEREGQTHRGERGKVSLRDIIRVKGREGRPQVMN